MQKHIDTFTQEKTEFSEKYDRLHNVAYLQEMALDRLEKQINVLENTIAFSNYKNIKP